MSYKLGKELKRIRQIKGVSLRNVEKATGISNAYLSQLERGDAKNPSPQKLASLSNYYQVPHEVLMQLAGYLDSITPDSIPAALVATAKAAGGSGEKQLGSLQLALLSANLSEDEEEKVAEYIAFLRSQKKKKEA